MLIIRKKVVILMAVTAILTSAVTGCGKLKDEDVVAEVGDASITADVANFYARYQQAQYETYYASFMGPDMWSSKADGKTTYEENIKKEILKSLEQMYILEQHTKDYSVEISEEEKKKITDTAAEFLEANELKSKEVISADQDTVERILTLLTIQEKMRAEMTADVDTEVPDEEAAQKSMQYVEFSFSSTDDAGNAKTLTEDEKAELKKTASAFLETAKTAKDLTAAAKEAGYEAKTATFDAETTTPNEALVKAADLLEVNGVTELIETDNGYYIGKLTSILDRAATDAKKETIVSERRQEQFDQMVKDWKKDTKINVHQNTWDKIDFEKQGVTINQETKEPYTENTEDAAEDTAGGTQ